ncbi:N-terminal methionine N(alpha)-acetyltransferase NatE [Malassezia psittaci]|uniref:N-terminal methionine N(alpha)-acetyltransferase NatE n=1 Tax=Malassezia psittaci TaxID=1821823 RepID=A0AAF0F8T3_9BASI|nr:N-terminal methionine N(alpha)-acetyltransferase NatE [Malassezia psittaci]
MSTWAWPPASYAERQKPNGDLAPVRRQVTSTKAIDFTDLTPNNLGQLRRLNKELFPISYSENVYKQVLHEDLQPICKLGLYNDIPVSNVCCRVDDGKDVAHCAIYIMTLGVLPAYRHLGIGTALLNLVLDAAAPGTKFNGRKVEKIYLHVHTTNDVAKQFYEKLGFKIVDTVADYYKHLTPNSAWLLEKTH